ncbi:ABC transporter permease subunit [Paenibacillus sp. USDA918EY]|nr:ABC transporter permease subunit [Paenibacillus sp. USDA918EY]
MGWTPVDVLTNASVFRPMLIVTEIWKSTGYGAIIYLAALANINQELYEAAIDGAGRWRQMWNVTLPGVRDVFEVGNSAAFAVGKWWRAQVGRVEGGGGTERSGSSTSC